MEIPKGAQNQFDISEDSLTDKSDDGEEENPFHDVGPVDHAVQGGLKQQLVHALELNESGINFEVADFLSKMYVEEQDYDLLDPIYGEYPEESEKVEGKSLVVHITTSKEGEDLR
ncbi:hypothetical protein V6Z11_D08G094300 [Gossypium hirsutum]